MKTTKQLEKEIKEVWDKVCESEETLTEFNSREKGFIKTKELQAKLQTLKEVLEEIDNWCKYKYPFEWFKKAGTELKQKLVGE